METELPLVFYIFLILCAASSWFLCGRGTASKWREEGFQAALVENILAMIAAFFGEFIFCLLGGMILAIPPKIFLKLSGDTAYALGYVIGSFGVLILTVVVIKEGQKEEKIHTKTRVRAPKARARGGHSMPKQQKREKSKEVMVRSDSIPPEVYRNDRALELAVYQHQNDPNWFAALYTGWRERFGDRVDLKVKLSKIEQIEVRTKALGAYSQLLKAQKEVETEGLEIEGLRDTRDLVRERKRKEEEVKIARLEKELRDLRREPETKEPPPAPEPPKSKMEQMKERIQDETLIRTLRAKSAAEFLIERMKLREHFEEQFPDDPDKVDWLMDALDAAITKQQE